ncbi:MAG: DUF4159 domain-containing protein [Caulobacterales bacterium]|nr:DUF4159 domain-containing protein [Caulobacterales bacterium]MCA0372718.1 DUF4159 domain-containing protein [Pseudomonadota bacterium]
MIFNYSLQFLSPIALFVLVALPIIYIVSRFVPKPPKSINFGAIFILKNIIAPRPIPKHAPLWLKILRLFLAGIFILACAMPILQNPNSAKIISKDILLVIDDDVANANEFNQIKNELKNFIDIESTKNNALKLVVQNCNSKTLNPINSPQNAKNYIDTIIPKPIICDKGNYIKTLGDIRENYRVIYIANNVNQLNDAKFFEILNRISNGDLIIRRPNINFAIIESANIEKNGLRLNIISNGQFSKKITIFGENSKVLISNNIHNGGNFIEISQNILRMAQYLKIEGQNNAAATYIIDAFNRRPLILTPKANSSDQPLLSDANFINSAMEIIGDVKNYEGKIDFKAAPNAIIFGDVENFDDVETNALMQYLKNGGTIIRFLGPKSLSKEESPFFTAPINLVPHILSTGFAVENLSIAPLPKNSIFSDIEFPQKINIGQSILLKSANNDAKTLINLSDGAPLLSMREIGAGKLYMFHTSAAPIWSDIGLSNLQLAFLKRIILQTSAKAIPASTLEANVILRPRIVIDENGNLSKNTNGIKPFITPITNQTKVDNDHYAGIYEGDGASLVINAGTNIKELKPQNLPKSQDFENDTKSLALYSYLLFFGFILLLIDNMILNLPKFSFKKASGIVSALIIFAFLIPHPTNAQTKSQEKSDDIKLTFLITPDNITNEQAKAGLNGISQILRRRTNIEPSGIIGLDPSKDELAKHPIIYWLLPKTSQSLPLEAVQNLNKYMQNGGILFIDTRGLSMEPKRAQDILKTAVNGLKIPPLEKVPPEHVLKKTFYILQNFPGFYSNASLWVQSDATTNYSANDGVSPIIISNGDLARAWAQKTPENGFDAINDDFAHELSLRVGINIYLYALTGQYKADQVHVRSLLERFNTKGRN